MGSLKNRVQKLEQERTGIITDPKMLINEELIYAIREHLDEEFQAGRFKDVEQKIRAYEATGKTLYELSKEEDKWFSECVSRVIEQSKTEKEEE